MSGLDKLDHAPNSIAKANEAGDWSAVQYSHTEQTLRDLTQEAAEVLARNDVQTKAGYKNIMAMKTRLVKARTLIESERLDKGRQLRKIIVEQVDVEARRLQGITADAEEKAAETIAIENSRLEEIENERIAKLRKRVAAIGRLDMDGLDAIDPATFDDLEIDARKAVVQRVAQLNDEKRDAERAEMIAKMQRDQERERARIKAEQAAEQKRLDDERAELKKQAEQRDRERQQEYAEMRARHDKEMREIELAKKEAAAQAAKQREEQDRLAKEREELAAAQAALEAAEKPEPEPEPEPESDPEPELGDPPLPPRHIFLGFSRWFDGTNHDCEIDHDWQLDAADVNTASGSAEYRLVELRDANGEVLWIAPKE